MKFLEQYWQKSWDGLGVTLPDTEVFDMLIHRYSEKHRAYHTVQHLSECFARFEQSQSWIDLHSERPEEILIAIWFHDAIYNVYRQDNEERSAQLAAEVLNKLGIQTERVERIYELIMATCHNRPPNSIEAKILIDIDLSVLGAESERFWEYEKQVRQEYAHVPNILFRRSRKKILKYFLQQPSIYLTPPFFERYEQTARKNLEASLCQLS